MSFQWSITFSNHTATMSERMGARVLKNNRHVCSMCRHLFLLISRSENQPKEGERCLAAISHGPSIQTKFDLHHTLSQSSESSMKTGSTPRIHHSLPVENEEVSSVLSFWQSSPDKTEETDHWLERQSERHLGQFERRWFFVSIFRFIGRRKTSPNGLHSCARYFSSSSFVVQL